MSISSSNFPKDLEADTSVTNTAISPPGATSRLAETGRVIVLDVHSYPLVPHLYELHHHDARPEICLGVDQTHTPDWLVAAARSALSDVGDVRVNEPFRGTYVPMRHYESDNRVSSLMFEIRRDIYTRTDGSPDPDRIELLGTAIAAVVDTISSNG